MEQDEAATFARTWGVGVIGAGMVSRAIHLPVLAGLSDQFAVRAIWDVDRTRVEAAAMQSQAIACDDIGALLARDDLDVIAVCSPANCHAEHAIAALRSGARVVLVEKPLCMGHDEAAMILAAARETGGSIVVGTMHLHDPAWTFLEAQCCENTTHARAIRSVIDLPWNERFEAWATEPLPTPPAPFPDLSPAELIHFIVMALIIHDLPLARRLAPAGAVPVVTSARVLAPLGYALTVKVGTSLVDLSGSLHGHWQPNWTLTATGDDWQARASFTPSFVAAGAGRAEFAKAGVITANDPSCDNGYVREWLAIADILAGTQPLPDPEGAVADVQFALAIANQAAALLVHAGHDR